MLFPDVTEILVDPDIGGGLEFTAVRTTKHRTLRGELETEIEETVCRGNIQPAQPEDLEQMPQEDRKQTVIVIRSTFHFQLGSDGDGEYTLPDEVKFDGKRYKINRVDDWSPWGFTTAWAVHRREVDE